MSNRLITLPTNSWQSPVANEAALPADANNIADARTAKDTSTIYIWTGVEWVPVSSGGGGITELTGDVTAGPGEGSVATTYNGIVPVAKGGLGIASGTSGGVPYYSGAGSIAASALLALNKLMLGGGAGAAPATLASLGTTTTVLHGNAAGAPTFAAVSLAGDVTDTLPVGNGGLGIASGTSGGVPYFSASNTIASSGTLTANRIVVGGGAGATPAVLGSLGTTTTLLHGNAAGAPTFGAVDLAADVTGNLATSHLASGTSASASTFWRGDGSWATPAVSLTYGTDLHWVNGFNGFGSTATKVGKYSNVVQSVTTNGDITYASSATNGDSWTINNAGLYAIFAVAEPTASTSATFGFSRNASSLTTNIISLAATEIIGLTCTAALTEIGLGIVLPIAATTVIRFQSNGAAMATGGTARQQFWIRRLI